MNRFKWKFEGVEAIFSSTEESHGKDIFKAAKMLGIAPETKTELYDNITNQPAIADNLSIDSNSASNGESAVPVGTKKTKAKQKAVELPDVYGIVGEPIATPDLVLDTDSLGGDSLSGDSVADNTDGEDA